MYKTENNKEKWNCKEIEYAGSINILIFEQQLHAQENDWKAEDCGEIRVVTKV